MVMFRPLGGIGQKVRGDARGFTIIELVIATLVFSTVMLVVAGTIVRFTNNYQRGLVQNTTQNATRSIVESISQSLQFKRASTNTLSEINGSKGYCIGTTRYSFVLGQQLLPDNPNRYALVQEEGRGSGCSAQYAQDLKGPGPIAGTELLGPNMRLAKFDVGGTENSNLYTVTARVVYGDDDLLCSPNANDCDKNEVSEHLDADDLTCKPTVGSQFCAVSELSTTVEPRL